MPIARIALDVPMHTLFDYQSTEAIAIGQRVVVPFGKKSVTGIVMECVEHSELAPERLKPVSRVLDEIAPLPEELLSLLRFCSQYYHYPLGLTVLSALPARLKSVEPLSIKKPLQYALSERGIAATLDAIPKKSLVQRRVYTALQKGALSSAELRKLSPASTPSALKALLEAGFIEESEIVAPLAPPAAFANMHTLTPEQQAAFDAVSGTTGFGCFLLHGITGSGKTEVYVHLINRALQQGGQVLLLVPEINLTPQLLNYFISRFPGTGLASLHSGLADGERTQNWLAALSGEARIILGTRLAVFTPLPQLSLIIVDEEHDGSFKQQDGLRYSARDVAIFRANQRKVPIVLGSATPSLESFHNAQTGRYRLLQLRQRALPDAKLPDIYAIDTRNAKLDHGVSEQLRMAIEARLKRGEQSLIFINRRGYAPVLMCTACGWLSSCRNCAGKLVLHLKDQRLRCHHCGYQIRVPVACPDCGSVDLHPVGIGTQRVENALRESFPTARILRVDSDSARSPKAWSAMRRQIHDGEADILVGTQMLAKGHDFPNLTLVGVLNPDSALYSADFRASEKLFALLAQVAGRAGRAEKPGVVLVQTAFPDHPLFHALRLHDFDAWAETLLRERKLAGFPPFVYQAILRAEGKKESEVYGFLNRARDLATGQNTSAEVYGAVPAAMPRRANHFMAQLLVQHETRRGLQQLLSRWRPLLDELPAARLRWALDIDPLDF